MEASLLAALDDPGGPVCLDVTEITRASLEARGWHVHTIDLAAVGSKEELLDAFAAALCFPSWFGRNWDAFLDCAADLSGLPGKRHLCWMTGAADFARRLPDVARVLCEVMGDVRERSREAPEPTDLRLVFTP